MAWRELGIADAPEPPARSIKRLKVFEFGNFFLHDFTFDLTSVNRQAIAGQSLEIDYPHSMLPQEPHPNSPAPDHQPTTDKPDQKPPETQE
jgi:hypothetical protein